MEEDAETKGYMQAAARKGGGFGMTLGEGPAPEPAESRRPS
jgi:hypothetical protein